MTEISFAKQFLGGLDGRAVKRSADFVEDPRKFPAQSAYILPKNPHKYPSGVSLDQGPTSFAHYASDAGPSSTSAPAASNDASGTIKVLLKSFRNPADVIDLPDQPRTTSIYQLKQEYGKKRGHDVAKIKILHNKKPCTDSKTVSDILGPDASTGEFSVMLVGAATAAAKQDAAPPLTPKRSIADVLAQDSLWVDLHEWLEVKLDGAGGHDTIDTLVTLAKDSWTKNFEN